MNLTNLWAMPVMGLVTWEVKQDCSIIEWTANLLSIAEDAPGDPSGLQSL